jgi:hypothetical protein
MSDMTTEKDLRYLLTALLLSSPHHQITIHPEVLREASRGNDIEVERTDNPAKGTVTYRAVLRPAKEGR